MVGVRRSMRGYLWNTILLTLSYLLTMCVLSLFPS